MQMPPKTTGTKPETSLLVRTFGPGSPTPGGLGPPHGAHRVTAKAEVRCSFISTTVREQHPRSHHKGPTGRVRTGDKRYPVLCHWDVLSKFSGTCASHSESGCTT